MLKFREWLGAQGDPRANWRALWDKYAAGEISEPMFYKIIAKRLNPQQQAEMRRLLGQPGMDKQYVLKWLAEILADPDTDPRNRFSKSSWSRERWARHHASMPSPEQIKQMRANRKLGIFSDPTG